MEQGRIKETVQQYKGHTRVASRCGSESGVLRLGHRVIMRGEWQIESPTTARVSREAQGWLMSGI